MDSWMQWLSPMTNFHFPASGDVWMDYRPWTNWGKVRPGAGNPQIEGEIFREVALPGRQLGKLTEAVEALVGILEIELPNFRQRHPDEAAVLDALSEMANRVAEKKSQLKQSIEADAAESLERLKRTDPAACERLIRDFQSRETSGPAE